MVVFGFRSLVFEALNETSGIEGQRPKAEDQDYYLGQQLIHHSLLHM